MKLNIAQIREIEKLLDQGMAPDAIADSIARMADLDALDREAVRTAAVDIQRRRAS
ncbi:hypothetical protein AB0N05_37870 [Nocardia sp. NPDC051030]|uniref:hypothetical protein n=1 Tax=Nocardia sp. NPDC051030 TaxID=3155162 RepID=UPI003420F3AE